MRGDYSQTHTVQTQNVYGAARMQLVASNEILLNALGILAFVNASAAGAQARVCVLHAHTMAVRDSQLMMYC